MKQEMSCPHSKTISTCPVCMIELNKITDKKSFVHSVEVAPGSYLVSPALINEIRKRTKDTEVLGGIHGVKINADIEAYVWVQRMTVQVRRREGIDLSGSVATHMQNKIFNAADFTKLLGKRTGGKRKGKRPPPLVPHIKGGIVIVRIPHGTPIDEATKATTWAHRLAAKINKSHEKDHYYEKGDWK